MKCYILYGSNYDSVKDRTLKTAPAAGQYENMMNNRFDEQRALRVVKILRQYNNIYIIIIYWHQ